MVKFVELSLVLSVLINPVLLGKITHKLEGEASMSTQSLTASGSSGAIVSKSGPYRCGTHKQVIVIFKRGSKFTNCPAGNHKANWGVVRESEAGASVTS
jgi:hypothetical protein